MECRYYLPIEYCIVVYSFEGLKIMTLHKQLIIEEIEKSISRGKGYSVYNGSSQMVREFDELLNEKNIQHEVFKLSTILEKRLTFDDFSFKQIEAAVIFQDLIEPLLLSNIDFIVNKIVYPLWFYGKSLIFISTLDKSVYQVDKIESFLIHNNYPLVIKKLLLEQLNNLLETVTTTISSPDLFENMDELVRYTPIEEIFSEQLIKMGIKFEPQVKLGRYYVDFLLYLKNQRVIVECDGKEFHDAGKDAERDNELKKEGYKIFRFSGSRIFNDCEKCVEEILLQTSKKTDKYILEDLNPEQLLAVKHTDGPMRVLAPAGSGKTKTLVNRIVQLRNQGVSSSEIIALAFNKKAADEMTNRLSGNFGLTDMEVRTFHSFGNDIIKGKFKWKFDFDKMSKTERSLLEEAVGNYTTIVKRRNKDPLDEYLKLLSKIKNDLLPIDEMYISQDDKVIDFEPIFNDYLKQSTKSQFYTFDDMVYFAVRILLSDSQLRKKVQNMYRYVLVDEFQDLNKVQLLLLQILALPQNNVFIVGDDDQMIYGFRGAELRPLLEFNNRYAITNDQVLKINYRSAHNIVRHSKWLIDHNEVRVYKDITPYSNQKGEVSLFIGKNLADQVDQVCKFIKEAKNDASQWSDFAILIRHNQYKGLLRIALFLNDIPSYSDGDSILKTRVGETLHAYLMLIHESEKCDQRIFKKVLNYPNRYFKNDFIERIKSWDDFINVSEVSTFLRNMDVERYIHFVDKVFKVKEVVKGQSPKSVLTTIINEFGLFEYFKDNSTIKELESVEEHEQMEIFIAIASYFDSMEKFLSYWEEQQEIEQDKDGVVVTTIHKTKGNEYKHVAYFNVVNSVTEKCTESEMEEERRIAYVAISRPKKSLLVTSQNGELSPLIKEIFLNPINKQKNNPELKSIKETIQVQINLKNVELKNTEDQETLLYEKFPELKGEIVEMKGMLKGFKTYLRKQAVNKSLQQLMKLIEQKQKVQQDKSNLETQINEVKKELHFRKLINEAEGTETTISKGA